MSSILHLIALAYAFVMHRVLPGKVDEFVQGDGVAALLSYLDVGKPRICKKVWVEKCLCCCQWSLGAALSC